MTTFEQASEMLNAFLPTLMKLQGAGFRSSDETYWRSRWHEWVNPHSDDSKPEFERKRALQLMWKDVWYYFQSIFCQTFHIPDRMKFKTHLVSCQQMADAFLSYRHEKNQPVDDPLDATLWYLRYHLWNETIQHGGLASESLWPATWPIVQEALKKLYTPPLLLHIDPVPVETAQLSLFDQ